MATTIAGPLWLARNGSAYASAGSIHSDSNAKISAHA